MSGPATGESSPDLALDTPVGGGLRLRGVTANLTVGEFSRMTHLSVKTLRHYHQVGLLEPAEVNPGTGYRYYLSDQIPTAQVIRRLRDLEMPVAEVREVLSASETSDRNALIAAHLDRLEDELSKTHSAVDSLRNLLQHSDEVPAVEHRTVPAMPAVGIQQTVDREDVLSWWQGALGELHAIGARPGPPWPSVRAAGCTGASCSNTAEARRPYSFLLTAPSARSAGWSPSLSRRPN